MSNLTILNSLETISTQYSELLTENDNEFLIEGLLYNGQIALLVGEGGVGKSLFALYVYECLSRGIHFIPELTQKKSIKTLFITAEDSKHELGKRLSYILNTKRNNKKIKDFEKKEESTILITTGRSDCQFLFYNAKERTYEKTQFFQEIKEYILQNNINLLIIDPFANCSGLKDENSNTDIYSFINALNSIILATKNKIGVIVLHHINKSKNSENRDVSSIRGASAIKDAVRLAILLTQAENSITLSIVKSNSLTKEEQNSMKRSITFLQNEISILPFKNKKTRGL